MTKDDGEAEELVQYVYGELYGIRLEGERRLSKFAHYAGRGSLGGWLRAVVYQCFIDRKRLTSRFEQVEEVEEFDRILHLADGHVVAEGTHDELMRLDGWYAEQWTLESERQDMARLLSRLPIGRAVPAP